VGKSRGPSRTGGEEKANVTVAKNCLEKGGNDRPLFLAEKKKRERDDRRWETNTVKGGEPLHLKVSALSTRCFRRPSPKGVTEGLGGGKPKKGVVKANEEKGGGGAPFPVERVGAGEGLRGLLLSIGRGDDLVKRKGGSLGGGRETFFILK